VAVGRVIFYSPSVDPYADAIAAMIQQYRPERIEVAFLHSRDSMVALHRGKEQSQFIHDLHEKISEVGRELQSYREAESIEIVPRSFSQENMLNLIEKVDFVDVTTVSKKISVELVAASLQNRKTRVCALEWLGRFDGTRRLRIGRDPYDYVDLTRLEQAAALRRSYAARAGLLICMGAAIFFVAGVSIAARWFPKLAIANEVLIAVSVATGFAGLYLAVRGGGK